MPQFLKIVWGTGIVPKIPQNINCLGNMGIVFPKKIGEHVSLVLNTVTNEPKDECGIVP